MEPPKVPAWLAGCAQLLLGKELELAFGHPVSLVIG